MLLYEQLLVFRLDDRRYALNLSAVERIVRAVEVTALPKAPEIVLGVIDVEGRILPVLNIRRRVGLPEREMRPSDQFLLARTPQRTVVLVIDEAQEVMERPVTTITRSGSIVRGLEQTHGIIQLEDGLALIYDLDRFLLPEEARALDEAMHGGTAHGP
jgi:purine-binding chemotaxis protein CheW